MVNTKCKYFKHHNSVFLGLSQISIILVYVNIWITSTAIVTKFNFKLDLTIDKYKEVGNLLLPHVNLIHK